MARRSEKKEKIEKDEKDEKVQNETQRKRKGAFDWDFVEMVLQLAAIRTVFLWGPPGVGKTYAGYHFGRPSDDIYAITLTQDTPAAELRGMWVPQGHEFVWRDGPIVEAMRAGARVVLNEVTHASEDVLALLYPVLESPKTARLTLPTGETVCPAPGFQVICTDNEPPTGLPFALQNRFDSTIEIEEPHPSALALLSPPLRRAALESMKLEPERALGLRTWLKIEELSEEMGTAQACAVVLGNQRGAQIFDALSLGQEALPF